MNLYIHSYIHDSFIRAVRGYSYSGALSGLVLHPGVAGKQATRGVVGHGCPSSGSRGLLAKSSRPRGARAVAGGVATPAAPQVLSPPQYLR